MDLQEQIDTLEKENKELKNLVDEWESTAADKDKEIKELEATIKGMRYHAEKIMDL